MGLMFTSSKVIPRIVVSNVFHPDLISSEIVAGGGGGYSEEYCPSESPFSFPLGWFSSINPEFTISSLSCNFNNGTNIWFQVSK